MRGLAENLEVRYVLFDVMYLIATTERPQSDVSARARSEATRMTDANLSRGSPFVVESREFFVREFQIRGKHILLKM